MAASDGLILRRSEPGDEAGILALLASCLGWEEDERHAELHRWKHHANPFGPSPAWVAVSGHRIVGLRTFMRWRFRRAGEVVEAVRAVDTATHPDHRGQGIFTRLTTMAIEQLREEGVAFVFNTPNQQSLPGYLKMGWEMLGRIPVSARPMGVGSLARMWHARVPAQRWSIATDDARPASDVFADDHLAAAIDQTDTPEAELRTDRTLSYLRWRYRLDALAYRAVTCDPPGAGVALFRLRVRGRAVEAVVGDVLVPGGHPGRVASLLRAVAKESTADYLLAASRPGALRAGLVPLPRQGPILTWRPLADPARPLTSAWRLSLGDVELF